MLRHLNQRLSRHFACALLALQAALAWTQPSGPEAAAGDKESPWLLTPLVSSDPKLSTSLGGLAAYIRQLDESSTPSLTGAFGTNSDTDSWVAGVFGD